MGHHIHTSYSDSTDYAYPQLQHKFSPHGVFIKPLETLWVPLAWICSMYAIPDVSGSDLHQTFHAGSFTLEAAFYVWVHLSFPEYKPVPYVGSFRKLQSGMECQASLLQLQNGGCFSFTELSGGWNMENGGCFPIVRYGTRGPRG